jgi:hypothetical protein
LVAPAQTNQPAASNEPGQHHDPNFGVAAAVIPCGKGKIVLLTLSGLMEAFMFS